MPFIGLTGGLGTGKTTVLRLFKNLGAHTINADTLVREVLKKPVIMKKLASVLGEDILIKKPLKVSINKKRMADIIFSDFRKRQYAEKVIHPEVIKIAKKKKTKILNKNREAVVVFEVPLLFEGGYEKLFDKIVVVYCSNATAINRLKRQGLSKDQAVKRMRAQIPISEKKACADFLINNSSNMRNTKTQVKAVFAEISSTR